LAQNEADNMAEVERLKSRMLKKVFFVMSRSIVDAAAMKPLMLEHYHWIIALEKSGVVLGSGPLFGADGTQGVGMTIFRADSHEAAEALAVGDPFVRGGAVTFTMQRWQVNEGRITLSLDFSDQTFSFG